MFECLGAETWGSFAVMWDVAGVWSDFDESYWGQGGRKSGCLSVSMIQYAPMGVEILSIILSNMGLQRLGLKARALRL
eukprot:1822116-Amphidinium_carterae.1